jgi:peroxin-3
MLPDNEEEELEFIRGAGFEEDYPTSDTSTISLRKLLDETKDFIDRYKHKKILFYYHFNLLVIVL